MAGRCATKLDPKLREILDACGVSWVLEPGSKHSKLRIAGRLVLTVPQRSRETGSAAKNALAAVRRHLKNEHGVEL